MEQHKIRKAVFPVAGLGTRFLPATKASPKEMLPIVDKPLIQYAAEEAIAAGAEVLIFITGRNKTSIPDHFDRAYELENELELRGKREQLALVRGILPPHVQCVYIRQPEALGLGHAVLCAAPVVGDEPFYVVLPDDLIDDGDRGVLTQMRQAFEAKGASLVGVQQVPREETSRYGIIDSEPAGGRLHAMSGIVEKPKPEDAPSELGVVGRYLLTPRIFELLRTTGRGAGGEIQLTDAIAALLKEEPVYGFQFEGVRYDCGNKLGYLMATVNYGLAHTELGTRFRDFLRGFGA
ncbi:MAG TPA: UTP--glucose-1-phosphate uridylyltransferase GalU [Gammaproteobacteria bacterium]|nr:UTP--glucose-1-phosphate uridylyltransferase GalU [Gammaproteobacteria bacterium]